MFAGGLNLCESDAGNLNVLSVLGAELHLGKF